MYNFCESELTHAKCTQDIYKIYHTFRQTFVYILYTKYIQKFVKMWDIFCISASCLHFAYIKCKMYA